VPVIELLPGSIFVQLCATKGKDVRMTETLQTAGLPRQGVRKQTAAAALTALGVVYGDIGTSTLFGLKQAVEVAGAPTPDTVMGIVSLILWALLLIVALKYAILILRADNHGEGGIVALWLCEPELALVHVERAKRLSPVDPHMFTMEGAAALAHSLPVGTMKLLHQQKMPCVRTRSFRRGRVSL
jgi:K+ potassium transporter